MIETITIPSFESYGNYSSENYGAHTLVFTDQRGRDFYFSYKTLVAFRAEGRLVVRSNSWGPTTGKHLNWIDGGDREAKAARLSKDDFERALSVVNG